MTINFFGPNRAYHEARRRFVFKGKTAAQESRPSVPGNLEEPQTIFLPVQGSVVLRDMGRAAPRINQVGLRPLSTSAGQCAAAGVTP